MIVYNNPKLLCTLSRSSLCRKAHNSLKMKKEQITAYRKYGMSSREIARKVNGSKTVIDKFLKNPKECAKKRCSNRPFTLTMGHRRAIVRRACLEKHNSTETTNEFTIH